MLIYSVLAVIAGFALLVWGADRFVLGASATARNYGVSPLVIGLTIVGFGTSAPEMVVSAMAALSGAPDVGIGNAIGSNITNIGLVLGTSALVAPLSVRSELLRREFPILFAIMLVALVLLSDGRLSRVDGFILLAGMGVMAYWLVTMALRQRGSQPDAMDAEYAGEIPSNMATGVALLWVAVGFATLLLSSRLLVWGAVNIAHWAGVDDLVIGLTVVAIGTSLPELAASVVSARKGEHDIAIGNVLGSNMFNLLAVLGLPGAIHPTAVPEGLLTRDYTTMVGLSVLLFAMAYGFRRPGRITRLNGLLLLLCYGAYLTWLVIEARAGAA